MAGRVRTLRVDVGDSVQAGQVLGSMDPVDLDARIRALEAAQARAQASVQEAQTRQHFAAAQLQRYAQLAQAQATSAESLHLKRQERDVAQAALAAAHQELQRTRAEVAALRTQRQHLQLIAPQAAIVTARAVEPGSTAGGRANRAGAGGAQQRVDSSAPGPKRRRGAGCGLASQHPLALARRCAAARPRGARGAARRQRDRGAAGQSGLHRGAHPPPPLGESAEVTLDTPPRRRPRR